jgi:hypothetical protein
MEQKTHHTVLPHPPHAGESESKISLTEARLSRVKEAIFMQSAAGASCRMFGVSRAIARPVRELIGKGVRGVSIGRGEADSESREECS